MAEASDARPMFRVELDNATNDTIGCAFTTIADNFE